MDSFFLICKISGLEKSDLEDMTIGMSLDYAEECAERKYLSKDTPARKPTQEDYDNF